jgi:hypothetical protein
MQIEDKPGAIFVDSLCHQLEDVENIKTENIESPLVRDLR